MITFLCKSSKIIITSYDILNVSDNVIDIFWRSITICSKRSSYHLCQKAHLIGNVLSMNDGYIGTISINKFIEGSLVNETLKLCLNSRDLLEKQRLVLLSDPTLQFV